MLTSMQIMILEQILNGFFDPYLQPKIQRPDKLAVASGTAVPCPDGWTKLNETLTHKLHYDKLDFILKSFFLKLLFKGIFSKLIYLLLISPFLYEWRDGVVAKAFCSQAQGCGFESPTFF